MEEIDPLLLLRACGKSFSVPRLSLSNVGLAEEEEEEEEEGGNDTLLSLEVACFFFFSMPRRCFDCVCVFLRWEEKRGFRDECKVSGIRGS